MIETHLLRIQPFTTPERHEKSKDLSTARGSTSSNRNLRLDFEQPTSRDPKELHALIQSSKRQLLQKYRKKQMIEEQIQFTAILEEKFLQLHESRRQIAISIAEEEMAIARYEREKEMMALEGEPHKDTVGEQQEKNHSFIEKKIKKEEKGAKEIEIHRVLKEIQPTVKIDEHFFKIKMDSKIGKQMRSLHRPKIDELDSKESQSSSQYSKAAKGMSLIESMLADISKLKNLDQLLEQKEQQKRIIRCLIQMEGINLTEPQPNQQTTLSN